MKVYMIAGIILFVLGLLGVLKKKHGDPIGEFFGFLLCYGIGLFLINSGINTVSEFGFFFKYVGGLILCVIGALFALCAFGAVLKPDYYVPENPDKKAWRCSDCIHHKADECCKKCSRGS